MNKLFTVALLGTLLLSTALAPVQADPNYSVNERQENQENRIENGVDSGELTVGETNALEKGQKHVNRLERRLKSDGDFTPAERARVQAAESKQSAKIHRLKHNGRDRD